MNTIEIGKKAEKAVAKYLKKKKYKILTQNWRCRWCEIDVIASKNKKVYFVEVKYRAKSEWGDGLDAITNKKLQQMQFAAEIWVNNNNFDGDYQLVVASVSGDPPQIENIVEV